MDSRFAQNELSKRGWKTGRGLGRTESGMKEAIKVKRKSDTGGLGHNLGDEFTFHWWDHIFNKAANSIKVSDTDGDEGVTITTEKQVGPVSFKKPLSRNMQGKELMYGMFVKAGTYNQSLTTAKDSDEEDPFAFSSDSDDSADEEDLSCQDTLERTFRLTGMTGHKGARHGQTMNGKLSRIMEQESNNNTPVATPSASPSQSGQDESGEMVIKKKKKKNKKKGDNEQGSAQVEDELMSPAMVKKQSESAENASKLPHAIDCMQENLSEKSETNKIVKKKRKKRTDTLELGTENGPVNVAQPAGSEGFSLDELVQQEKPKKKKRKNTEPLVVPFIDVNVVFDEEKAVTEKNKKKKKKNKVCIEEEEAGEANVLRAEGEQVKMVAVDPAGDPGNSEQSEIQRKRKQELVCENLEIEEATPKRKKKKKKKKQLVENND